jgi:hypothetical protein
VFLGDGRVEDNKERDERRWGNYNEKQGLTRISCTSQFTITDMTGTSPNVACNLTDERSSQPNQPGCTPDIPYSSTSFASSSTISLFFIPYSTIITKHKVMPSLPISPCHDHELTPSTVSTQDCLSSLHAHDYELTSECIFSLQCASLHDRPPSASSPRELKENVAFSNSHVCKSTN